MSPQVACPLPGDRGYGGLRDSSLLNSPSASLALRALLAKHKSYQDQPSELASWCQLNGGTGECTGGFWDCFSLSGCGIVPSQSCCYWWVTVTCLTCISRASLIYVPGLARSTTQVLPLRGEQCMHYCISKVDGWTWKQCLESNSAPAMMPL